MSAFDSEINARVEAMTKRAVASAFVEAHSPARAVRFDVLGKPVPKARPRMGKGGRIYTPRTTADYEAHVMRTALLCASGAGIGKAQPVGKADGARFAYFGGPVEVELAVFFPDRRRRDLDNAAKSVLDGLQLGRRKGTALLADDDQVVRLVVTKAVDRERPRVEVTVREVTDG